MRDLPFVDAASESIQTHTPNMYANSHIQNHYRESLVCSVETQMHTPNCKSCVSMFLNSYRVFELKIAYSLSFVLSSLYCYCMLYAVQLLCVLSFLFDINMNCNASR